MLGVFFSFNLENTSIFIDSINASRREDIQIAVGAYDPAGNFAEKDILIEHVFLPWRKDNTQELELALLKIQKAQRFPMLSLEPWPWNWNGMTGESLFKDILAGKYDESLLQNFQVIQALSPQNILVRWGHEMEIVGQYPWSKADSQGYIQAYRHVVDLARQQGIDNIQWVWSPAGNLRAKDYWPGDTYVDYVGISIYAHPQWNRRNPGQLPTFRQLMAEKYPRVRDYQKPIIIAELGVEATNEQEEIAWLGQVAKHVKRYPQLRAIVYFNQRQPDIVPLSIGQPKWELSPRQISYIVNTWNATTTNSANQPFRLE